MSRFGSCGTAQPLEPEARVALPGTAEEKRNPKARVRDWGETGEVQGVNSLQHVKLAAGVNGPGVADGLLMTPNWEEW